MIVSDAATALDISDGNLPQTIKGDLGRRLARQALPFSQARSPRPGNVLGRGAARGRVRLLPGLQPSIQKKSNPGLTPWAKVLPPLRGSRSARGERLSSGQKASRLIKWPGGQRFRKSVEQARTNRERVEHARNDRATVRLPFPGAGPLT